MNNKQILIGFADTAKLTPLLNKDGNLIMYINSIPNLAKLINDKTSN